MSDVKARAEARRQAILARGNSRLAKLTSSARGPEGEAILLGSMSTSTPVSSPKAPSLDDDPPLPSIPSQSTHIHNPPTSDNTIPSLASAGTMDPFSSLGDFNSSAVTGDMNAMQIQLMEALMGGPGGPPGNASSMTNDPLAQMMQSMLAGGGPAGSGLGGDPTATSFPTVSTSGASLFTQQTSPVPKTGLQHFRRVIHFVSIITLVVYFLFWLEPARLAISGHGWGKWGRLHSEKANEWEWSASLSSMPLIYPFLTLQLILHSLPLFFSSSASPSVSSMPTLLTMALPHLPAPLPTLIMNGYKWLDMIGMLLDDLALVVFAVGAVIWWTGSAV